MLVITKHLINTSLRKMSTANKWLPQDHISPSLKKVFIENASRELTPSRQMLFVFHIVEALKYQRRTGWVDRGIEDCESISDHLFRITFMSQFLKTPGLDISKCSSIALAHDVAEAIVGDITPTDTKVDKAEKSYREKATIDYLSGLIKPYNEKAALKLQEDWDAYEYQTCIEAKYVKDLDKYELLVQTLEYEKRHPEVDVEEFWGALNLIKTDEVKGWAKELIQEREDHRNSK